jgi:hypothetical protein
MDQAECVPLGPEQGENQQHAQRDDGQGDRRPVQRCGADAHCRGGVVVVVVDQAGNWAASSFESRVVVGST